MQEYLNKKELINEINKRAKLFIDEFEKITDESLKNLVKSDPHSPPYYRVNGVLENMDAFHELFKTKKGDKLYKEPKDRIKIW